MSHTVYRNASGLPNDEQVTTARDQATLAVHQAFGRTGRGKIRSYSDPEPLALPRVISFLLAQGPQAFQSRAQ
jgi:hypothetical protein